MSNINVNFKRKIRKELSIDVLSEKIKNGNRYALSQALTLIESTNEEKRLKGLALLGSMPSSDKSIRIGITGSPGSGKSSFIEAFGTFLIDQGFKIAVLAVDPSSTLNDGSILGDKTRMANLSTNPAAYIRPTPSSNHLGGVSRTTKEAMHLCEYAGYDIVIVESVGVGQSEIEISHMVDVTILLLLPGAGDDVQGIKRGVMELADILIVNKSDDDRMSLAQISKKMYRNAVSLLLHPLKNWQQPILLNSNYDHSEKYKDNVWRNINKFITLSRSEGYFAQLRNKQDERWLKNQIQLYILAELEKKKVLIDPQRTSEKGNIFSQFTSFVSDYKYNG